MRLGDLDALYDKVSDHVTSVSVCATAQQAIGQTDFKRRCLEDIRNAPTIPAIPVDWIRKYADTVGSRVRAEIVREMFEAWQKEQEAQDE